MHESIDYNSELWRRAAETNRLMSRRFYQQQGITVSAVVLYLKHTKVALQPSPTSAHTRLSLRLSNPRPISIGTLGSVNSDSTEVSRRIV